MMFDSSILVGDVRRRDGVKKLGYPRVENIDPVVAEDQDLYRPYVHRNIFDMDDPTVPQEVKDNAEFVVDVSDPQHSTLNMQVVRNEARAAQQKALRDQIIQQEIAEGTYGERMDKNVFLLYIDNLSRAHFMRKMPKTAQWLEQFVDNPESDYTTYQYFKYHSVYYNTLYSNDALYFGQVEDVTNPGESVFNSYSENGYMTGFFKDSCETHSNSFHEPSMQGINRWDHFGGTIACDGNFDTTDFTSLSPFTGKMSAINHCLYGMNMHQIQLNYAKQFWEAYPDNRKIFRTHFSEAHELSGELVKYIDEDVRDFLQWFYERGYLEDTFLTIMSDHGAHALTLRFPAFPDNSRYIENYYPVLFHVSKNDLPPNYAHFLAANEQAFISSHDIYSSLKSIAQNQKADSSEAESYPYTMSEVPSFHDCSDETVFVAD